MAVVIKVGLVYRGACGFCGWLTSELTENECLAEMQSSLHEMVAHENDADWYEWRKELET